jgi:GntR family transcriptional regulator
MLYCVADVPQWDPDAGGPAYVYMRVADHIAARIAAGDLPTDARLPGERELAAEYGVAIGTARRAVEELRERGLVVTLPGKGTYVIGTPGHSNQMRARRESPRRRTLFLHRLQPGSYVSRQTPKSAR